MRRKSFFVIFGAIALVSAIIIWQGLAEELRKSAPVEGFEVFLERKDICTLAFNDDEVWAGGIDGLFVYRDGSFAEVGDFRQVKAVIQDRGVIWAGHDDGVTRIESGEMITLNEQDGLPDRRVNALAADPDGVIWAGTWGGIALIINTEIDRIMTSDDGLIDDMVNVITLTSRGDKWIGSYVAPRGGATVFSDGRKQLFSTDDGLLHSNINAIIELADNVVLAGGGLYTKGGGTLFIRSDAGWMKAGEMTVEDGIAGEKIRSVFLDSTGSLWVGSEYDGLAAFRNFEVNAAGTLSYSEQVVLTTDRGLPNNEVKVISQDPEGRIWIGTRSGLLRIDKGGSVNVWGSDGTDS